MSLAGRAFDAVVFDQDGTLVNTFIPALTAYSAAVGRPIAMVDLEPVAHLGAARNLLSALLGRPATDEDDDRFHLALADAVTGELPYGGVAELLTELRGAGLATGVATNSDGRSASIVLGSYGLDSLLDVVVTVDQVGGVPKPAPDSVLEAVRRLGAAPGRVVFVGDSEADMLAARAAGVYAVAAGWGQLAAGIDPLAVDSWADSPDQVRTLVLGG